MPDKYIEEAQEIVNKWHGDGCGVCPEHGSKYLSVDEDGDMFCDAHEGESPELVGDREKLAEEFAAALRSRDEQHRREVEERRNKIVGLMECECHSIQEPYRPLHAYCEAQREMLLEFDFASEEPKDL